MIALLAPQFARGAALEQLAAMQSGQAAPSPAPSAAPSVPNTAASNDAAWSALVDQSSSKNVSVAVWGMDQDETRHSFTVTAVKSGQKTSVYIIDDENAERYQAHRAWVTDQRGAKLLYGDAKAFAEYKSLLLKLAIESTANGHTRTQANRGDCMGSEPFAPRIDFSFKSGVASEDLVAGFTLDSCSTFEASRETTHPSPMVSFDGWRYKSPEGYVLVLQAEAGDPDQEFGASLMLVRRNGSTGAATELGSFSNYDLGQKNRIAVKGPIRLDDYRDPAKTLKGEAVILPH